MSVNRVIGVSVSRTLLIVVIVFAGLGMLASLVYGSLALAATQRTGIVSVHVASTSTPQLEVPDRVYLEYGTVDIGMAWDNPAMPLLEWAALLPFITGGVTALVILLLAVQLLRGKPFGVALGIAMLANALLAIGSGIAVPALVSRAEEVMVAALDMPRHGPAADWVSPTSPDWTYSDWSLILLGLVIGLGGWLVLRGNTMQRDLEGTI